RWLPGRPWQKGLVDDEIAEAHRLADFLHVLQALPTEGAPPAWFAAPGKALRTSAPAVEAALLASYGLAPVDAIRAAWLKALELHDWEGAGVWLHGDLLPGNFLVHGGRIAAVIDWGTPGLGDPARDLMPAWTLLAPAGRAAFRSCFSYDSDVWRRARAMVFTRISNVPYYWETNRGFADEALENIGAALDDDPDTWEE
ncbi:MAG TPA: phosphotransferase, partial [Acidimicrobiales bacterium]|nr:phosphotransferase [Acidimicrobiales bacterium]